MSRGLVGRILSIEIELVIASTFIGYLWAIVGRPNERSSLTREIPASSASARLSCPAN